MNNTDNITNLEEAIGRIECLAARCSSKGDALALAAGALALAAIAQRMQSFGQAAAADLTKDAIEKARRANLA